VEIRRIDRTREADIRLPNEPFPLFGRMIPALRDGVWSHTESLFGQVSEMCFPEEGYTLEAMPDCLFLGAYEGETCVGLAVLQKAMFRYMYLYDLKVCRAARRRGAGSALIREALRLAREAGYRGLYTVGQDNNLAACRFYLRCGFRIGGCDTEVYRGTKQEGKTDILFYLD
jgi:ribosomal protein S18 acetylase RimI-like enzyme